MPEHALDILGNVNHVDPDRRVGIAPYPKDPVGEPLLHVLHAGERSQTVCAPHGFEGAFESATAQEATYASALPIRIFCTSLVPS